MATNANTACNPDRYALSTRRCVPCEGGVPPLTPDQARRYRQATPEWHIVGERLLERTLRFQTFAQALEFVNRIGRLAEDEGHHPDIHVHYTRVRLELCTHAIGGLSENDFIVAAKIDALAQ